MKYCRYAENDNNKKKKKKSIKARQYPFIHWVQLGIKQSYISIHSILSNNHIFLFFLYHQTSSFFSLFFTINHVSYIY